MLLDIKAGSLLGSFSINPGSIPMLFSHAGARKTLVEPYNQLQLQLQLQNISNPGVNSNANSNANQNSNSSVNASELVRWINGIVRGSVVSCLSSTYIYEAMNSRGFPVACGYEHFQHPIYSIGQERGGGPDQIGGVFWTDYSILSMEAEAEAETGTGTRPLGTETGGSGIGNDSTDRRTLPLQLSALTSPSPSFDFIQIVGHTVHMHEIVSSPYLLATCVDAGMVGGGRAYLEIDRHGRMVSHTKVTNADTGYKRWVEIDMSDKYC